MNTAPADRPVRTPDPPDTRRFQPLHCRQQRPGEFLLHGALYTNSSLPGQMTVKHNMHINASVMGMNQRIDNAIVMIPKQVTN